MNALMRIFQSDKEEEQFMSTLVDPFNKQSVDSIWLKISRTYDKRSITYKATVYFENGPTKGEHNLDAPDFSTLVKKAESFLKSLEQN